MSYPQHLSPVEASIIEQVLERATALSLLIRVYDGEGYPHPAPTADLDLIRPEITATDTTTLYFYSTDATPKGYSSSKYYTGYIGSILLVHGNDEDVVSDMGAPDENGLTWMGKQFNDIEPKLEVEQVDPVGAARKRLEGRLLAVSLIPYQGGIARVVSVKQSHVYGRPSQLIKGRTTITVEAVEMTETSRLFGSVSVKPVRPGTTFEMCFWDIELDRIHEDNAARYTHPF